MVQTKELEFIPPKKRKEPKKDHIKKNNVDHVKIQVKFLFNSLKQWTICMHYF